MIVQRARDTAFMRTSPMLTLVAVMGAVAPRFVPGAPGARDVLAGAVIVPEAWGIEDLTVTVQPLGRGRSEEQRFRASEPRPRDERGDVVLEWELEGPRVAGPCFVSARSGLGRVDEGEMPFHGAVLEAAAGERCVLRVPRPATVELRAVDDRTGVPLPFRALAFSSAYATGLGDGPPRMTARSEVDARGEPTGVFRFRAHQGAIEVRASFLDPAQRLQEVVNPVLVLRPPGSRHLVRFRPSCGYVVVLREGAVAIGWEPDWESFGRQVDGVGSVSRWGEEGTSRRFVTPFPGRYRFAVPDVEGYAPVPEQEVLVHAGEFTEHVIQLERR